jgi:hypothetical protein
MAAKKKEASPKPADAEPAKAKAPKAEAPAATSKFATFLTSKKLDPRRVLLASRQIESLQPEDRALRLAKRSAKSGGDAKAEGAEGEAKKEAPRKPRSGRPVTRRSLAAAMTGGKLSGPAKTRLLRAVNRLLEQKKSEKVDLKALF